jgi:hypothetical protein
MVMGFGTKILGTQNANLNINDFKTDRFKSRTFSFYLELETCWIMLG